MAEELLLLLVVDTHALQVAHYLLGLQLEKLVADDVDYSVSDFRDEAPVELVEHEHVPHPPHDLKVQALREECYDPLEQVELGLHLSLPEVKEQLLVIDAEDVLEAPLELRHFLGVAGIVASERG